MNSNKDSNKNDIPRLQSDIIKEIETYITYSSDNYHFIMQLKENTENINNNETIIVLSTEKINVIENFTYIIAMNFNEFLKFKLFKMCDTIEEIYDFILNLITEKKISIKEVIDENSLTISIKSKVPGFKDIVIVDIELLKKDRNDNDLIKILKEKNNELKDENKGLKEKIESINVAKNETSIILLLLSNILNFSSKSFFFLYS